MGLRELAEDAARLGHGDLEVRRTVSGRRWEASCSCGWPGRFAPDDPRPRRTWATETEAMASCMWHVRTEVKRARELARSTGVSFDSVLASRHALG